MTKLREEAIQLFDGGDSRSFDEIYGKENTLFEDVDDVIDPRMKKLFEATYQTGQLQQKHLRERRIKEGLFDKDDFLTRLIKKLSDPTQAAKFKKKVLGLTPYSTKKEILESDLDLEAFAQSSFEDFGISSGAELRELSEQEQQQALSSVMLAAAVLDKFDELLAIISQ
jgi:hypothetical protein